MENTITDRLPFKKECSLEKRKELSEKIRNAHPDRVPVIVEKHIKSKTLPNLSKRKFLAPGDLTFAQFLMSVREHIRTNSSEAIFWSVGDKSMSSNSKFMDQIYSQYKDEDGFLYVNYIEQDAFGKNK